jgi:hypothetical protein
VTPTIQVVTYVRKMKMMTTKPMLMIRMTSNSISNVTKNIFYALVESLRAPTPEEMAIKELEGARRELLNMLTAQDYSKRMVEYHLDRIKRLTNYLAKANNNEGI